MTPATALQFLLKVFVSGLAIALLVAFLFALWRRDLDVSQYKTQQWLFGRWFESWFPENPNLLKNGDFERGSFAWGTGWIEALPQLRDFARKHRYVNLGGAQSLWSMKPHGGRNSSGGLRVEHVTPYQPHVFSTLSQQIETKPSARYHVRFWAKLDSVGGRGGLTVFAGVSDETAWELGKKSLDDSPHDWKEYEFWFITDDRVFVDLRLRAEGPLVAWIDDISLKEVH